MKKIWDIIVRNWMLLFTIGLYSFLWVNMPVNLMIEKLGSDLQKSGFLLIIIVLPSVLVYVFHYIFKYYVALLFSLFLSYKFLFRKDRNIRIILSLVFSLLYIVIYFLFVQEHTTEFPIPMYT